MKGRTFYSCLLIGLFTIGLTTYSLAQTITTGNLSSSVVCPGGTLTVPYTTSGTFVAGNVFSAQLSSVVGDFPATPVVIGSVTSTTAGIINIVIPSSTAAGSRYQIRVVSSNPSRIGSQSNTVLTVSSPAAPSVTTPSPYCEGDTPNSLSATPSAGGTLNWYGTAATGGTATTVATKPVTTAPGATYYVSQTVNGCESPRFPIVVTVRSKPAAPGTSPKPYCLNDVPTALTATSVTSATLIWYGTDATNGTPSSTAPTPSTKTAGPTTYYVSQTLNGCEGPRAGLTVTVTAPPAAPKIANPAATCQGGTPPVLSATADANATLRWYGNAATGGAASTTPSVPSNQVSDTYYVSQVVNGCESPRTAISTTIKPSPAAPLVETVVPFCQNQTASPLSATASTGGILNWYGTSATGGSPSQTPTVPDNKASSAYYVSQTVNGCEGPRAVILVTVKAIPNTPSVVNPVSFCLSRTATALVATPSSGGTLNWYGTNPTSGTASATAPVPPTSVTGTMTYYVSQSVNGCESARVSTAVTVNPVPAPPAITTPAPVCEGVSNQSLSAIGQNLRWYGTNATGGTGSSVASIINTSASSVGTNNYYVTQTTNGCESDRAAIPVRVKDTPDAPGTSNIEFCQGSTTSTLTASLVASATANWYDQSGTALLSAPIPSNSAAATYNYAVSQTVEGCTSLRATLSVRVKQTPGAPGVSPISFCNNGQAQPLSATGNNLKWYDASGNPLNGTPTPPTNSVGGQVYKVSQTSNENCEGPKADLIVTINPLPGQPGVVNLSYCQIQPDQPMQNVQPLTASGQNLRWYNTDGNSFPGAPTPTIDRAGTQSYQVTQTVNNCESTKATVQVTINTVAAPTVAKPTVAYCINDKSVPLQATGEPGSSLRWIDPYGRMTNDAPTPPTTNTNVKLDGDEFYVYQIATNGCYSPRSTIRVIVNTTPTLSLLGSTNVNLGLKANLQLKFTGTPPFGYTITGGYSGVSRTTDTTIAVLPRGNTTYQVAAVSNGCGLGLPGNPATAIVTVQAPTVTTGSLNAGTLCSGVSIVVPFTTSGQLNPGNTFLVEMASVADTSKKYTLPATATNSPVTVTIPTTLPGGAYYVRAKATNPEIGITGSNSPTVLTVRSQPSATLAGTQTIYEGTPANLTVALGGDGPWTFTYTDSTQVTYPTVVTTTNPYLLEVRPARTTTYRITSITNGCGTGTVAGSARVTVAVLLGVEDDPLDAFVKVYPVPTSSRVTVDLDLLLNQDSAVLTLTDLRGRSVMQRQIRTRQTEFDLSTQPNGLYLLRIQVGDRQTVRKVIKF